MGILLRDVVSKHPGITFQALLVYQLRLGGAGCVTAFVIWYRW